MKMPVLDTILVISAPLVFMAADALTERTMAFGVLGGYGSLLFIYFLVSHHSERRRLSGRKLGEYAAFALLVVWAYASLL